MIEEINKLINSTFHFLYYDKPFSKGQPYIFIDENDNYYFGFDEKKKHFDFTIRLNDVSIENISINQDFRKLRKPLSDIYASINSKLYSLDETTSFLLPEALSLLETHLINYDSITIIEEHYQTSLLTHLSKEVITNDDKKYIEDLIYYKVMFSEYFKYQRKYVKSLIDKIKEIPMNSLINKSPVNSGFIWKGTDTDLLELIVAIEETNSLGRSDRKVTRVDIVRLFESIFNTTIKDPESKLTRAKKEKKILPPTYQGLKQHLTTIAKEKQSV
jgi:hypothetical protein